MEKAQQHYNNLVQQLANPLDATKTELNDQRYKDGKLDEPSWLTNTYHGTSHYLIIAEMSSQKFKVRHQPI